MTDPWYITFQPAIAAAIGFGGVVATLLANGYLQRRAERLHQEAERESIRSAVLGEMKMIEAALDRSISSLEEDQQESTHFVMDVSLFEGRIFDKVAHKVGALDAKTAQKVVEAYVVCGQAPKLLAIASNGSIANGMLHAPVGNRENLRGVAEGTKEMVREAIDALENAR